MKLYDVIIEVKNIRADNEEEAKRIALDLITSPSAANIGFMVFEHKQLARRLKNEQLER